MIIGYSRIGLFYKDILRVGEVIRCVLAVLYLSENLVFGISYRGIIELAAEVFLDWSGELCDNFGIGWNRDFMGDV